MSVIPGKAIALNSINANQLTAAAQTALKGIGKDLVLPIVANLTTDGAKASNTTLPDTPVTGSISVFAGTMKQILGDGVKTTDCYFSGDNGSTARALTAIVAGDLLYFNAVIANLNLATTDLLNITYRV